MIAKYVGLCVAALLISYALTRAARMNQWSNLVINGVMPGAKRRAVPAVQCAPATRIRYDCHLIAVQ